MNGGASGVDVVPSPTGFSPSVADVAKLKRLAAQVAAAFHSRLVMTDRREHEQGRHQGKQPSGVGVQGPGSRS